MAVNPVQERTEEAIHDIRNELVKARKHFGNSHTLAALQEEVGELAQAMIDLEMEQVGAQDSDVYEEAVQVAAMAIRVATEGDDTFDAYDPSEEPSDMQLIGAETWAKMSAYQKAAYFQTHEASVRSEVFDGTTLYQGIIGSMVVTGWKRAERHARKSAEAIKYRAESDGSFSGVAVPMESLE
jgi:NTP pyrophosphatase (non-canonical NTP hydrolase)